jgi:fatty acid desaturase
MNWRSSSVEISGLQVENYMIITGCLPEDRQAEEQTLPREARELVRDLHKPDVKTYLVDMILSVLLGWTCFAFALTYPPFSMVAIGATVVAMLALYRGLCFIHEIAHLRPNVIPGFETAWNLLCGAPLLMPSFLYTGVHQHHHGIATYGTEKDPEYLPFAGAKAMIVVFQLQSLLIPVLLVLRFLVLSPLGWIFPRLHNRLCIHASSFTMNLKYEREVTARVRRKIIVWELVILLTWGTGIALAFAQVIPYRVLLLWWGIVTVTAFINSMRTLGAHRYVTNGEARDRDAQLLDSIDTPGGWWTELWAPVGLRYHALHHYFPGIPYHNLGEAHRRLARAFYKNEFEVVISRGLPYSLRRLFRN